MSYKWGTIVLVVLGTCGLPALCQAKDAPAKAPTSVAHAKDLYYQGRYQEAVYELEDVLARSKLPQAQRIEALKTEAFCLFLLKLNKEASGVWRKLLAIEPNYRLDPVQTSPEILGFFRRVGEAYRAHHTAAHAHHTAGAPPDLAAGASTRRGCGVFLCMVPFGVGQFANGRLGKGLAFAGAEVVFLALNIGLFWHNKSLVDAQGRITDPTAHQLTYVLQMVSLGGFVVSAILGVIDAYVFP